jgi:hypothetical protein
MPVKRILVMVTLISAVVFATSAIALAENGPRWPVFSTNSYIAK